MTLNQLKKQCTDLIEARAGASYAPWNKCLIHKSVHARGSCQGAVTVCEFPSKWIDNADTDFIVESGNNSAQIASALLECIEALEKYKDTPVSGWGMEDKRKDMFVAEYTLDKITSQD